METLTLASFQSAARVAQLAEEGVLHGRWDHVPDGWQPAYRTMVMAMETAGVPCDGRPPMWAWSGPLTWGDAFGLLHTDELATGFHTVTFVAPARRVLLSDYGPWCDALTTGAWRHERPDPGRRGRVLLQATLPSIRHEWVTHVEPLPTHDVYSLDWDTQVGSR